MSLRNRLILPFVLSSLAVLGACGGNSNSPTPPPSGGFSNSSLTGTYVFSTTGADSESGALITIVGTFQANGSGGITAGTLDATDPNLSTAIEFQPISGSSSYNVTADGRGQAKLGTGSALGTVVLDFVLTGTSHGLVTEFDANGTGSGTLDAASTVSQGQLTSYAFSLSGIDSNGNSLLTAGALTLNAGGTITSGVQDLNDFGLNYPNLGLGGSVTLNSDGTTGTAILGSNFGTLNFDFYAVDATHLKLIETDDFPILSGDAYSQTSATIPAGAMAFTLAGANSSITSVVAGGFMVSDGAGNITSASTEDVNAGGSPSSSPLSFGGPYVFHGPRATLSLASLYPGTSFVGYPSSGGLLLLEMDSSGVMAGSAIPQTSTSLAATEGYGFNFTGINLSAQVEVDDISEFVSGASTASPNMTGLVDENSNQGIVTFGSSLSGTYGAPDGNGRGSIVVPNIKTINGGFGLNYYTVDGSNFLFIELDNSGQVGLGSFELQNTPSSAVAAKVLQHPLIRIPKAPLHAVWKMHSALKARTK